MTQKRILIISNNVLSKTNNNGKTLFSLFSNLENIELSQLYFSNEVPTIPQCNYFKVSDRDLINKIIKKKTTYGVQKIRKTAETSQTAKKHNSLSRLLRELLWKNINKISELKEWVLSFNPNYIFFVGGDCIFAYRIFNYIFELLGKKTVCSLFITDDYISKKGSFNPFELLRKAMIKSSITKTLKNIKHFYTISNKMSCYYQQIFGIRSKILFNIQFSVIENCKTNISNKKPVLLYAGSLYYGRDKAIADFASHFNNVEILICSNQVSKNRKFKKAIVNKKINFLGKLDYDSLNELYKKVDYLLYVESFRKKYINKIRYSFSTKITDYLSTFLPIVCYGPRDVGSIEELSNYSLYLPDKKIQGMELEKQLLDDKVWNELLTKTRKGYKNLLDTEMIKRNFLEAFE